MNIYSNPANIMINTHTLPLGKFYKTYEWLGKPYQLVRLDAHDLYGSNVINYFKLKLVKEGDWGLSGWYARTDSIWLCWAWSLWLHDKITRLYIGFRSRMVLTFEIWGFGYTEQGSEYHWANIRRKKPF